MTPTEFRISPRRIFRTALPAFLLGSVFSTLAANAADPVKLLSEQMHLGDQEQADMKNPKPDAKTFEAKFDWPDRIGFGEAFLVVEVSHMTPRDYPGVEDGFWQTEVLINGRSVGILNELLRGNKETAKVERIILPFEVTALKTGENTLTIKPGAKNGDLDDMELHSVEISANRPR